MIENLKYNWSFMRIIRLILGFIVIGQSIFMKDVLFGIAGVVFVFMALFNMGCCSTGTVTYCYSLIFEKPIKY